MALRVLVVIPDAVRAYRVRNRLVFANFGKALAYQTEKLCTRKFAATKVLPALPPGAYEAGAFDLVVILEDPRGEYHSNGHIALSAGFEVRGGKGDELFRTQEDAEGNISNDGEEQVAGSVVRDFLQELIRNERVQAMLAPKPDAGTSSALLGSYTLDDPPPPPWVWPVRPAAQNAVWP